MWWQLVFDNNEAHIVIQNKFFLCIMHCIWDSLNIRIASNYILHFRVWVRSPDGTSQTEAVIIIARNIVPPVFPTRFDVSFFV